MSGKTISQVILERLNSKESIRCFDCGSHISPQLDICPYCEAPMDYIKEQLTNEIIIWWEQQQLMEMEANINKTS